jgi:hypothetical protein
MIRSSVSRPSARRVLTRSAAAAGLVLVAGAAVMAQPVFEGSASLVEGLRACRALPGSSERLACYDDKVGVLLGAVDAGDVRLVDREQVRKTRRQLFGLSMPEVDILKPDAKDAAEEKNSSDLFETTIANGRQVGPATWRFTTVEGAVWEINNPPRKIAPINAGDKVVFKKAALGYYFIRINGQIGVKGRRVS